MQKHLHLFSSTLIVCVLFLQCGKDPIVLKERVYVAGVEMGNYGSDSSYGNALLWINGNRFVLNREGGWGEAKSVFVTNNNDVYVAGFVYKDGRSSAVLWKNMQPIYLNAPGEDGQAFSIYVSGKDVYVSGSLSKNGVYRSVVWKNRIASTIDTIISYPWSLFIEGKDQYVIANTVVNNILVPGIQKNSVLTKLEVTAKHEYGEAMDIYVQGKNVYAVGTIFETMSGSKAAIWHNGVLKRLYEGSFYTTANAVTASASGDVYVSGMIDGQCVVWKNYVPQYLNKGVYGEGFDRIIK